ncbi:MAG: hypothetical protein KF735_00825 [Chelatococcus sp.]|uniref:hypothetical protein n=1 Tax=Chelatococcus sp. TaxID=1953771 RepID=UPI0025BEA2BF|nr:hypothetical protein [Chelatococcus sp.]MBX3536152.1 hypothetical protein [Chelatococcus sp.]
MQGQVTAGGPGAGCIEWPRRNPLALRLLGVLGAGLLGVLAPHVASATEWMYCHDARSRVSVGLLLGLADTVSVVAAILETPKGDYTTSEHYGTGKPFAIRYVRGMMNEARIGIDFMGEPANRLLGELRLRRGKRGDMVVYRGTLTVTGEGSWKVSCDAE